MFQPHFVDVFPTLPHLGLPVLHQSLMFFQFLSNAVFGWRSSDGRNDGQRVSALNRGLEGWQDAPLVLTCLFEVVADVAELFEFPADL